MPVISFGNSSYSLDYPTIRPTLDLNFAATKILDPKISFSRSSTGTYFGADGVLKTVSADQARFDHDPSTRDSLGLLVEEARTNNIQYSQQLHLKGATNAIAQPYTAISPDGTSTATLLTETTAGGYHSLSLIGTTTFSANATLTAKAYLKNAGVRYAALTISDGFTFVYGKIFDLQLGTVGADLLTAPVSASIKSLPNGWYECVVTATVTGYSTANSSIFLSRNQQFSYTGDGVSGVYIWGAQLEAGTFPTSYIPTPATFTSRASSATYYDANGTVQTAGTNVARSAAFFPDSSGVMRSAGLLLEAAGTNLLLRSQELDNVATWAGSFNLNYTANTTTAPDSTTTAEKVIPSAVNSTHSSFQDPAGTISGTYTFSIYAKASGYNRLVLFIDGASSGGLFGSGSAQFDLSTKAITNISGSATIETLPNGWYRCSVTGTSASAVTVSTGFSIYDNSGNSTFTGNGTDGIFIWGAQLEASPYPTSYIATTTATVTRSADVSSSATVTRSADVASITGTNFSSWYRQDEGTVFCQGISNSTVNSAYWTLQGTSANGASVLVYPTNSLTYQVQDASVLQVNNVGFSTYPAVASVKTAAAIKLNNFAVVANGGAITSDTSGTVPAVTSFVIGNYLGGGTSYDYSGTISRLTYWPTRLSNSQLQLLTQ